LERSTIQILLVEDFKPYRDLVISLLGENPDLQIICEVSDGLEAVERAQQLKPDLVVMDIGLPRLNGLEAARRIHELTPSTKILFLTQETAAEYVQEALSLGALGYVNKSGAGSDLLPAIDVVLAGRRFVSSSLEFGESAEPRPRPRHEILFCPDEAAFLDGLTRFIASALNAGAAVLVLLSPSHQESIHQRLHAQGVDINAAIRRGIYVSWDAAETPDQKQFFKAFRSLREAATKAGKKFPRVALCSERTYRLWAEGKTGEVIRLEQFCNDLVKNHDVDILCPYPALRNQENAAALTSILAEHSTVISG